MNKFALAGAAALTLGLSPAASAADRCVHANNSAYDTLDPHIVGDGARVATRLNFGDGLHRWVDNPPVLILWIATSHEVSEDGLVWTFKLRDDVKDEAERQMTGSLLSVAGLSLGFHGDGGFAHILDRVNLEMRAGEIMGLVGESEAELARGIAAGRTGTPADIAQLVAFLALSEPCFITGQDIVVDGFQWVA